jgi:hypothetical protein
VTRLDYKRLADFLVVADDADLDARGRAIEDIGELLFSSIPGISIQGKRVLDVSRAQEVDLVLRNEQHERGLPHLPYLLYAESKNWRSAIGPNEVSWFATKVRERNGTFGIILVRDRISGLRTLNPSGAYLQLLFELERGCELILLTRSEIERVRSGERLAKLLMKKLEYLKSARALYEASDDDLAEPMLRARVGIREAIRQSRVAIIAEFQAEMIPDGRRSHSEAARALTDARSDVDRTVAAVREDDDPLWLGPRSSMISFGTASLEAATSFDDWSSTNADWVELTTRINAPRLPRRAPRAGTGPGSSVNGRNARQPAEPRCGLGCSLGELTERNLARVRSRRRDQQSRRSRFPMPRRSSRVPAAARPSSPTSFRATPVPSSF